MSAAGPSQGARPPQGGGRAAPSGGGSPSAAGPSQGARPPQGGGRATPSGGDSPSARAIAVACLGLALVACGGESHQDLRTWMAEQGKGAQGKLEPLPQIRPYDPFSYNAFDLPDPFKPRKIEPTKNSNRFAPDLARRREPLEAYPLEALSMVGTLARDRSMYALVRTPDRDIFQVRAGNFMGQNFGVVTGISDTEIKLKELVQDSAGDWSERSSALQLQQPEAATKGNRK